jgi:DNA invertase Pin-like site-specific DNA recombinase
MGLETRVAVYTRVSTEDQAKEGFSLEAQRERLEAYCKARGWVVAKGYVEDGHSGRDTKRPAYQRMMAERDAWDTLLVIKMDRIHRNSRNFMEMMESLQEWGKNFVSATESFDTSTAMGRFVMDIIQRIAQLESEQIGERVYMGMSQKARTGPGLLGFTAPFGYDVRGGSLHVCPEEAKVVREVFDRCLAGETTQGIAETLNARGVRAKRGGRWTHARVLYILHNPLYSGFLRWDGIVRSADHPAIVPRTVFNRAQEALQSRVKIPKLVRTPAALPLIETAPRPRATATGG